MQLKSLITYLGSKGIHVHGKITDIVISDIVTDSRNAVPGCIFFAINGESSNGIVYINDAIERGASIIITKSPVTSNYKNITYLTTLTIRNALSESLGYFYNKKAVKNIAAVTGTNGKTSVAYFCECILTSLKAADDEDAKVVNIGTIGVFIDGDKDDDLSRLTSLTTPDNASLHKIASRAKVENIILEASSHGLVQGRLAGIDVNVAAITNISHDHLDYHKTIEGYVEAKCLLFSNALRKNGFAIINADMDYAEKFIAAAKSKEANIILYGKGQGNLTADIKYIKSRQIGSSFAVVIEILGKEYQINTKLVGDFQIENLMCAVGMIIACGYEDCNVVEATQGMTNPQGRLEVVAKNIFVDFAHTPAALECALKALRRQFNGYAISVIFGCGGNRDKDKRPMMGRIASNLADRVYITDDNPRAEDSEAIISEIALGITDSTKEIYKIGDREKAIKTAIDRLQLDEILLIAGKGHEDYQIVGNERFYFSDKEMVKKILDVSC